jgi:hypothetical protein
VTMDQFAKGLPVSLLSLGDQFEFDFRWLATHFSDDPFYLFNVAACRFIRSVAVTAVAPLLRYRRYSPDHHIAKLP